MASMVNMANTGRIRHMQRMNKVDFHTHILPAIDDGSQSEVQSYRMLQLEKKNGVAVVLATPHFYPDDLSPTEFAKVRQAAYEKLMTYAKEQGAEDLPVIKQGAEVLLCTETADLEDLRQLAIEGTDYILIEMPYRSWDHWMYEAIEKIKVKHGLTPVIAHVERYVPMHEETDQIYELLAMDGVLGQMNLSSLLDKRSAGLCHKMIECHMVHVFGSDAHRGKHLVEVTKAYDCIAKKYGTSQLEKFHQQGVQIVNNQKVDKQVPRAFKRFLGRFYK